MTNHVTPCAAPLLLADAQRQGPSGTREQLESRLNVSLSRCGRSSGSQNPPDYDGIRPLRYWPFISGTIAREPWFRSEVRKRDLDSPVCDPAQAQKPAPHPLEEDSYATG